MARHTSFKTGGPAEIFATPKDEHEIKRISALCRENNVPCTLLGRATNVLVPDKGLSGVVMQLYPYFNGCTVNIKNNTITAQSGLPLHTLANIAYQNNLAGLSFASGIPGSVGGAVYMNAGAYGYDIASVCESATLLTQAGEVLLVPANQMEFGYRHSIAMENGCLILSATFRLQPGNQADIKELTDDLNGRRKKTQPLEYPSAGSVFKRPSGYYAGSLIADCGLKGYTIGGAQVSGKHAGFIVNVGNATTDDVLRLIDHIQRKVYAAFMVMLEPEIRILRR